MIFTPDQIQELKAVMDRYAITFIAHNIGTSVLSDVDKLILQSAGFSLKDIDESSSNVIQAFKFGLLSDALGNDVAKRMTYDKFKDHLSSGRFIPLNPYEKSAIEFLQFQAAAAMKLQVSNMKKDLDDTLVHVEKGKQAIHSKVVTDAAKKVIEERKSVQQLKSIIGHKTQQWDRNLGKMADYVLHEAFNNGRLASVRRKDSKVYFDVYPGACKHCVRLYLTGGVGSQPRVFTPEQLIANGTNIGKKVDEWKATVSGIHPHCRCTINEVPQGYVWNEETKSFDKPKLERKVERKSKVKVTVGDKVTEI